MTERCHEPELMDDFGITGPEVDLALREIGAVNRYLGGVATSLAGLAPRLRGRRQTVRLLDVGTGGGDLPIAIARRARRLGVPLEIVAVDLGADACRRAHASALDYPEITVVRADVFTLPFPPRSFHLAHCAMFLHHFTQEEIARILARLGGLVREGIVINDLHRHALAYHSIRILTRLFSRSRLFKNDAPLSVRRAFRAADLDDWQARCGFPRFRYRWRWAFRYLCEIEVSTDGRAG
jgi:ubiquinone/menaquinone biosynthesis C-methylase UbiE